MTQLRMAFAAVVALAIVGATGCDDEQAADEQAAAPAAEPASGTAPTDDPTTGGDPEPQPADNPSEPTVVTVDELAQLLDQGAAIPVDANNERTREEHGVIPNARLLTSSSDYDVDAELPSDRDAKLVFYCANEHCSASDGAAGRALSAGYTDVSVLRAGIVGWAQAGQPTERPRS